MQLEGKIAFIGGGAMAEAIIKRMIAEGLAQPEQICVSEPVPARRDYMTSCYGTAVEEDNLAAVKDAKTIVFAIKPQVLDEVMPDLHNHLSSDVLVISIMAGIRISTLRDGLNHARIVRSMPNTPAQIGKGMTVWTATTAVNARDREHAQAILEAMGEAIFVVDEHYLDAATGLSGSGPGYVFLLIEALIDAGVHVGFSYSDARQLVLQTIEGSVALMRENGTHPATLRNQVTSPGGTTAAGILELERHGVRSALIEAVNSAYLRSKQLGDLSEK
jgi:pyrroline-5-carboxylate reductase